VSQSLEVRTPRCRPMDMFIVCILIRRSRKDMNDPGVGGLEADTSHLDCTAFDFSGGEKIVIDTLLQGKSSAEFSAHQVPFGGVLLTDGLGSHQQTFKSIASVAHFGSSALSRVSAMLNCCLTRRHFHQMHIHL